MRRRDFVRTLSALPALRGVSPAAEDWHFVGIQCNPNTILDEGIEHALDLMRETARINSVVLYTHTYYAARAPQPGILAQDHGTPLRTEAERKLPRVWVRHKDEYFRDTPLRHHVTDESYEYGDRDLFREIVAPARKRGMRIYVRLLEAQAKDGHGFIKNWDQALTKDLDGKPGRGPCWNNPHYQEWTRATIEDLFRNYELDGIQYGAERTGPLSEVLFRGFIPSCFCEHCVAANRTRGTDAGRAREGYRALYELMDGLAQDGPPPVDGVMTGVFRILQRWPETLAWNYQWLQADQEIVALVNRTVKAIKPEADLGQHVDHQRSSWDIFYRAAVTYEEMAEHCDFVKPILYHDILAPRMRWWVIDRMKDRVLNDLSEQQALGLYYSLFRYDPEKEPELDALDTGQFSADYVYRETKRCVAGVKGKAKVYAGIGFDVPWNDAHYRSRPEDVYEAVMKAYEAGADGMLASRKYAEMRVVNVRAFGRAVAEAGKA